MYTKVVDALTSFWRSLPHEVQAVVVMFATVASTALYKSLFDGPSPCWAWSCIEHALGASLLAGAFAVRAFYMRPGPGQKARGNGAK